ncbi:MAG: hypothetical protein A2847_01170 [Candidatus Sungbacteria bacterium RIFCSPHIGHO2_01_FULL_50_25]|uniref:dolichyl-phosphate beta-glucosyltransferase n=1 Tax=Candidatus Sungbacteria bacterium RIFCSPHIGHO2_01_FULL_50_25 TaxID=1802265 RepID=A0A1G2K8K8_9BACT|nr:MAG: hypothetical protein A2847_01170 [Candidatus Sungbacteria bacterium RIFCSPHIGHO2_01_FULL_50_25]
MYLSWIIPAKNEVRHIEKTILEVDQYLRGKNFEYEIIVADNGSTDATAQIVDNLRGTISHLKLLKTKGPGKGWAVREGMLAAGGEYRIFADADNSVSPGQLDSFIPHVCKSSQEPSACFDVVIGSIEIEGASVEEHAQWYRRALGKFSKYVIRVIAGLWEIRDTQRGFKLFSRRAAEIIFSRQRITTWGFDIEVLVIAKRHGFRIKEVPVRWVNPAGSKVGLGAYVSTFRELLEIKWNDIRGIYR